MNSFENEKPKSLALGMPQTAGAASETAAGKGPAQPPRCLLIVEDDGALRGLLCRFFKEEGYRVLDAGSCDEAVALFRRKGGDIDGVLLDMMMPAMGGPACCRALLEIDPCVRILLAAPAGWDSAWLRAFGAAGWLEKPYDPSNLRAAVAQVFGPARA